MKLSLRTAAVLLFALGTATLATSDSRDWSLVDTQGETFRLASVRGSAPVLLVFWATWCVPCKKEMDQHRDLFDSYQDKGVQVLLVSEDTPRTQSRVKPYMDAKRYGWRVLLDPTGSVLKRYGGTNLPYMVLLDRDGMPVEKIRGILKRTETLTARIDILLGADGE
ncbi:TlpA family protein disulfide reductase [bacterium]|nr:TlpA family protein disulfide reductase [bacterium]MBU1985159.1 TlpA family protein disulfide reductase [bacterium]